MAEIFGYARVSSDEQDLEVQRTQLKAAGCTHIREEKVSGKSLDGRDELNSIIQFARKGDQIIVCKLDRLARSTLNMLELFEELGKRGIGVKSLAEPWADSTTPASKFMLTCMAGVAEFERGRLKERQTDGIKRARENGEISKKTNRLKYAGGTKKIDRDEVLRLKADGKNPTQIAGALSISRSTVYAIFNEMQEAA